jgi:hypothetical protein
VTVEIVPAEFSLVSYDARRIAEIFEQVAGSLGLPAELTIRVEVDERTPLARTEVTSVDPVVLTIESGAFEANRKPRHLSDDAVTATALRLLGRVRDRRDPAFGSPPPETELTLTQGDAWDAYCLGRATRLGYTIYEPRWRYRFRTRHGFSDVADRVFDRLWAGPVLAWGDLDAACTETAAASGEVVGGQPGQ